MRFLLDQDVYALTAGFLRQLGHDVVTAADLGGSRASDSELLEIAQQQDRLLVTRDRDFGSLVFLQRLGSGVIYLRVTPTNVGEIHDELLRVLQLYPEAELHRAFVVVERGRHRFRRIGL